MRGIKIFIAKIIMLNKRLYKKPSFLLVLALILALTVAMSLSSKKESGIVRVSVFAHDPSDPLVESVFLKLREENSVILYDFVDSLEAANQSVISEKSDCAFILPDNLQEAAELFVEQGGKEPFIEVLYKNESVLLNLVKEKLYAVLYPTLAYALYEDYMAEKGNTFDSDEEMRKLYQNVLSDNRLIDIKFDTGNEKNPDELNYLSSPLRGLLSVAILIATISAGMYFIDDREAGVLAATPQIKLFGVQFSYCLTSAFNTSLVVYLALAVSGLIENHITEITSIISYAFICVCFSLFFSQLIERIALLGAFLPLISILCLVACPIFINIRGLDFINLLLPPYYYLEGVIRHTYIVSGLLFGFILLFLAYTISVLRGKRRKV